MLLEILVPVTVFTGLILSLSLLVLVSRRILTPSGLVAIELNGQRTIDVPAGQPLLAALANQGVFLPAACGGRGSCGQCRVRITAGAEALQPIEAPLIGDADAAAGIRLACMVRVRAPMSVHVPEDVLSVQQTDAVVVSSRSIATYLREIVLSPATAFEFEAGDYVVVEAPAYAMDFAEIELAAEYRNAWRDNGFLRLRAGSRERVTRAYSLANPPGADGRVTLVVRIALPPPAAPAGTPPGLVSSYLFGLKPGASVPLRGPYGDFHARDTQREMIFLGGGAGIAPLRSIILDQIARGSDRRMSLWYGARDVSDLCYVEEFRAVEAAHPNFTYHLALSDPRGSYEWRGDTGFIHSVLRDRYLKDHPDPAGAEYYLCGPPLMSAAALHMLEELGVPRENVLFDDFGA